MHHRCQLGAVYTGPKLTHYHAWLQLLNRAIEASLHGINPPKNVISLGFRRVRVSILACALQLQAFSGALTAA